MSLTLTTHFLPVPLYQKNPDFIKILERTRKHPGALTITWGEYIFAIFYVLNDFLLNDFFNDFLVFVIVK
jgi:hypothetical protein